MMTLNGFYNEDVLVELLQDEKISYLDFIYHHSLERKNEFRSFCEEKNLLENEEAAMKFFDYLSELEEKEDL